MLALAGQVTAGERNLRPRAGEQEGKERGTSMTGKAAGAKAKSRLAMAGVIAVAAATIGLTTVTVRLPTA